MTMDNWVLTPMTDGSVIIKFQQGRTFLTAIRMHEGDAERFINDLSKARKVAKKAQR